jgi:fatty acid amide hydrolase 2
MLKRLPRSLSDMQKYVDRLAHVRQQLDERFGDDGVMIYPPYSRPAPRHNMPLLTPFDSEVTAVWNVLGYPVTGVPIGFSQQGLPVAVQVVARRGQDHLTLAVAAALEQRYGGWVRAEPPPIPTQRRGLGAAIRSVTARFAG